MKKPIKETKEILRAGMRNPKDGMYYFAPVGASHVDVLEALEEMVERYPKMGSLKKWQKGWVNSKLDFIPEKS